jgi:ribosomal protein S12 methylthiotransferase accessory factor
MRGAALAFWQDADAPAVPLRTLGGLASDDAYAELDWVREQLRAAGVEHLIAVDLSRPELAPARVVRVLVPGLETNNPYHTGPRAQLALLEDLLPQLP